MKFLSVLLGKAQDRCKGESGNGAVVGMSKVVDVRLAEPVTVKVDHDTRSGLQDGRDKELAKFETILYAVASGLIVLSLGVGNFCYANGISLRVIKWMISAVILFSSMSIIALMISDYAAVQSREIGMDIMDGASAETTTVALWDMATGLCNKLAHRAFIAGMLSAAVTFATLLFTMPDVKPAYESPKTNVTYADNAVKANDKIAETSFRKVYNSRLKRGDKKHVRP